MYINVFWVFRYTRWEVYRRFFVRKLTSFCASALILFTFILCIRSYTSSCYNFGVLPDPGMMIFRNRHSRATGTGRNGIASCMIVMSLLSSCILSDGRSRIFKVSSCVCTAIPLMWDVEAVCFNISILYDTWKRFLYFFPTSSFIFRSCDTESNDWFFV